MSDLNLRQAILTCIEHGFNVEFTQGLYIHASIGEGLERHIFSAHWETPDKTIEKFCETVEAREAEGLLSRTRK